MITALALKIAVIDRIEDRLKAKPTAHVSSATAVHTWMETSSAGSFSDADGGSDGCTVQAAPGRRLRSGFLRELTRPLNEQSIGMGTPTPSRRRAGRTVPRAIQRLIKREQM